MNARAADPLVTVGLPVFEGEAHLAEAIESILGQDLPDLELLLADNGSTDRTEAICRAAEAADPRVRYLRSPVNRGAAWNYNRLVPLARAPHFKWAAHDDLLAPSFLRRCVEALDSCPDAVLAYPRTLLIDEAGEVLDADFVDGLDLRDSEAVVRWRRYLVHPGEQHPIFGVIRTDALRRTGLIANCWGGDQVTLSQLLLQGQFHEVPERLFLRRYHPASSLVANTSPEAVARWYDTSADPKVALPRTRLTYELLRVANHGSPSPRQRARCTGAVLTRWVPRYARVMAGELKRSVRAHLSASPSPGGSR